jgi:hypothetical protein
VILNTGQSFPPFQSFSGIHHLEILEQMEQLEPVQKRQLALLRRGADERMT